MKIGILQTGHAPDQLMKIMGDYDAIFAELLAGHGFTFDAYDVENNVLPSGADAADGWLITGSRHGAYEDHPWINPLEDLIRDIVSAGRPLIGICFGHQIIAQALGGRVEKFSGGWEVGLKTYETADGPISLYAWHQDQVVERPATARVLARNATCENAVLAYGDTVLTVQAHPEYDQRFIAGLATFRGRGVVPDDRLAAAFGTLGQQDDNRAVAEQMAALLKQKVPA